MNLEVNKDSEMRTESVEEILANRYHISEHPSLKMYVQLLLLLFLSVYHNFCKCELPVVISRGAFIKGISGVTIYNEIELLHHILSGNNNRQ